MFFSICKKNLIKNEKQGNMLHLINESGDRFKVINIKKRLYRSSINFEVKNSQVIEKY